MPLPSWKIIGASVAGARHIAAAEPCQDSWGAEDVDNTAIIIAVCDGAGSARLGGQGAALAAKTALASLSRQLREMSSMPRAPALMKTVKDIQNALVDYLRDWLGKATATEPQPKLEDLATTILLCIINAHDIAILQIGDGGVVGHFVDGSFRVLTSASVRGEYVNETVFVTSPNAANQCMVTELSSDNLKGIAIFSDGVELLSVEQPQNIAFPGFYQPIFQFASTPGASNEDIALFLSSPQVCEHTDDDKTLVLVTRGENATV